MEREIREDDDNIVHHVPRHDAAKRLSAAVCGRVRRGRRARWWCAGRGAIEGQKTPRSIACSSSDERLARQ